MSGPIELWQHQADIATLAAQVRANLLPPRHRHWPDYYLELWLDSWTSDREAERAEAQDKLDELESIAADGLATWYNERDKHMSFCTTPGSPRLPSASLARVTMRIEDQP